MTGASELSSRPLPRGSAGVRFLAVLLPLVVVANRFLVYTQLFVNDFVVAAIAGGLLLRYGIRLPRRVLWCVAGVSLFVAFHSAAFWGMHPEMRETIFYNFLRMEVALAELVAFCSFYSTIPVRVAIMGLRWAAWILAITVVAHLVLLNFAGDFGRQLAFLQQHEIKSARRDLLIAGFARPFGISAEPAMAAGYLFLMASLLLLAQPGRWERAHWFFLFAALATGASSMLLFAPAWLYLLCRRSGRPGKVAGFLAASLVLLFAVASVQVAANLTRAVAIVSGEDASASLRFVPVLRTLAGTWEGARWTGFGIGQSRLADAAGSARLDLDWVPEVESELYSGVVFAEMFGDFGIPGLLMLASLLYFCALPAHRTAVHWWWLVCILLTQNCYVYRNPQLYYWCGLGIVLARSRFHLHAGEPMRRLLMSFRSAAYCARPMSSV